MTDSGYFNLCAAILQQAVKDYRTALFCGKGSTIRSLENFFRSDWGQALSMYTGEAIIRRVRAEVAEEKKNRKNGTRGKNKVSPKY